MKPARVIHIDNATLMAVTAALVFVGLLIGWFAGTLMGRAVL